MCSTGKEVCGKVSPALLTTIFAANFRVGVLNISERDGAHLSGPCSLHSLVFPSCAEHLLSVEHSGTTRV